MGIIRNLKGINKALGNDRPNEEYVKVPYLKIADGETVGLRFLQELDEDSPNYNKVAGSGFVAIEHQAGQNWKRRALCSKGEDEDAPCYGCEKHAGDYTAGWKPKAKLYINGLVTRADGTEEVVVVSQGNGPKSITPWLLEYAGDSGTITSQPFKLKRKGSGQKSTEYSLIPGKYDDKPYDVTQHELFDLNLCVRDIPYSKQKEYYLMGQSEPEVDATEKVAEKVDW